MSGKASTVVAGVLATDPEPKDVNGKRLAEFSIPISSGKDQTTWWKVSVWGAGADVVLNHFKKGDPIVVEGQASARAYKTKDGEPRAELKLTVFGYPGFLSKGGKKPDADDSDDVPF